ncbi:MAG: DNA polymerase II [Thermoplasmatales archaeon]|nr:DNA polymerase II [Thermoplasmatales archaeon]
MRILSASYRQDGDGVVIELFGKTREKRSITVLVHGFLPYFFVVEPRADLEKALANDPEVVGTEHDRLLYRSDYTDVLKVTIKYPWKVPEYRNQLKKDGYHILAADIPFHHRYMYDADMGACIRVTGEEVQKDYVTDLTVRMEGFENVEPFDPGLKVLSFDIENSVRHDYILTLCAVIEEDGEIRGCAPIRGNERDIITAFGRLIMEEDPDVISGYNIDNYDIRKIDERAKAIGLEDPMPWGRDLGQPRLVSDRFWRVKGRLIVDAWWAAKKELRPKQETLNAVSMEVLGETKMDVDPRHMDDEWKADSDKVVRYCLKDAELSLRILLSVGTLRKGMDLAAVSKLSVEDVLTSGTSTLVDSLLIREADRRKIAVPLNGRAARTDQIEGGYVHTMNPGLYHWVCVLDFKSMYPSLIIAKNICFTTLSEDGEIVSPSGARFMSKERRLGLLPKILEDLMKERDRIKARIKASDSESEKHYLDGLQGAVKVLMNTFYGVFASSFYRFTDKSIGSAITSFARSNVKSIIEDVTKEGIDVIYSDTDSVFMQSPRSDLEGSVEFGRSMAARFSKEGGTLEFEKLLEPLFTHGKKKRYVGRVVWPERSEEILIRGYEVRRSDSFNLQSDLLTQVFEDVLDERSEDAVALVKKTIQDVLAGRADPASLVISKNCRGMDQYENPERMSNVQASKKLIALGYEFIPGMKVSWIVTDASVSPQRVEPYISGAEFTSKPDYRYYAERLAQSASRITEVFGWSEKDLMMGSQQSTLFDTSFDRGGITSSKERQKKEPPKPGPRSTSLSDFF